jgi:hypothetical protein
MLGKWFRRDAQRGSTGEDRDTVLAAAVADERRRKPLAGAQVASKEILGRVMEGSRSDRGVHVESLFMALGALAGFACQMSLRAVAQAGEQQLPFTVVTTADQRTLYFGDALNAPLAEEEYSVWGLAAAGVVRSGAEPPDLGDIFRHVVETVGTPEFGRPRYPEGTGSATVPETVIRDMWPDLLTLTTRYCGAPNEWPIAFGLAIQEAIGLAQAAILPSAACRIAMEAAVAMSKIDPVEVGIAIGRPG